MQPPRLHRDKPGNLVFNCFTQFYVLLIVSPVSLVRLAHLWVDFRVILSEQFYVLFISYFHRETETGAIFQLVQQGHLHGMKTTLDGFSLNPLFYKYSRETCFSYIPVVLYFYFCKKKDLFRNRGQPPRLCKNIFGHLQRTRQTVQNYIFEYQQQIPAII